MKIATYRVGGERRVGLVDEARQTVAPFDIPEAEAQLGVLALIDRPTLPRVLSPMPLQRGRPRSADPAARAETSIASARTITNMRRSSRRADSIPARSRAPFRSIRSFFPRCRNASIAHRDPGLDRSQASRRRSTTRPNSA